MASNLGVRFDSQLTMRDHVTATCRSCFPVEAAAGHQKLIDDWCSQDVDTGVHGRSAWLLRATVYYMVSARTSCDICRTRVQNAAARFITGARKYDLISPVLLWSSLVTSATKDNLQDRHFDAPVLERFGKLAPLPGNWLYHNLVYAWPKTVAICNIRTAIHTKNQDNDIWTKVVQGLWSHNLEWSAYQIEGFFSEQKLFQKIASNIFIW